MFILKTISICMEILFNFSLFRLKINNMIKNESNNDNNENAPIEFIDISIPNYVDENTEKNLIFYQIYLLICDNKPMFLKNKFILNDIIIELPILSSYYMFIDIYCMLYTENYFPWTDIKYAKRLTRLLKLFILCNDLTNLTAINFIQNQISILYKFINNLLINLIDSSILDINQIFNKIIVYYNSIKIYLQIQGEIYKYIINIFELELTNKYLLFIYYNIFEQIISLIYMYRPDILNPDHRDYCDEHFYRLIDCDNNANCNELNMNIYSFAKLKNEPNIENFIKYLKNFLILINYIKKYVTYCEGLPNHALDKLY